MNGCIGLLNPQQKNVMSIGKALDRNSITDIFFFTEQSSPITKWVNGL